MPEGVVYIVYVTTVPSIVMVRVVQARILSGLATAGDRGLPQGCSCASGLDSLSRWCTSDVANDAIL